MSRLNIFNLFPLLLALSMVACHGNVTRDSAADELPSGHDASDEQITNASDDRSVLADASEQVASNEDVGSVQELHVSPNNRFLMKADGSPFFWLSDTQWEIVHKSTREQATEVLADRQAKGFTAIQIPLLFHWSISSPNKYGNLPGSPDKWNEAFWEHADYVVDATIAHDMNPAIFPAWGNLSGGKDNIFSGEQAYRYGQWVANRYKDREGVVYVVGGDRTPAKDCCGIVASIAEGIKSVSPNRLVSFHSWYLSRTEGHANADWMDFSTMQTSHNKCSDAAEYTGVTTTIMKEWNASPHRPVIDMEPRYENIDGGCGFRFNADQTRVSAYWAVFAGSFGIGYGHHPLWYWGQWGDNDPNFDFEKIREDLNAEFASQVQHLKNLMLSRPFFDRLPDPELVGNAIGVGATRGDGYIMVYAGQGQSFDIDTASLNGKTVQGWWFNPRDGSVEKANTFTGGEQQSFTPPGTQQSGNDWVLVLDDSAREFPQPGMH